MKEHSTGSSNSFILFLVLATSLLGLFSLWNLTSLSQNQLEQFTLFRSEFRQFYERNNENDVTSSNDKVGLSERLSSTRGPLSDQSEKLQDTQFDSVYNTNAAKKRVEETLSDRRNQVLHKPHLSSSPTSHLPHSRSHKLSGAHLPIVEKPPTTSSLQNRQQQQQHQQQQHRQGSVINLRHEQQHRTSNELAENDQQQQQQQPNWIYKETNHNSGPELMIGVMTARHHFLERQVLRETWVNYIHHNPELSRRVQVKFVVGEQACDIPTQYRTDIYDCKWSSGALSFVTDKPIIAYAVPKDTVGTHTFSGPLGMDFFTNYQILLTHLGVFDSGSDGLKRNITASLYIVETNQLVARVNFTTTDPGELREGSRFKKLPTGLLLPKGYTFSIVAEGYGEEEPCNNIVGSHGTQHDGGGLISFLKVSRYSEVNFTLPQNEERQRMESNQYAAGTFIYEADESTKSKTLSDPRHFLAERQNLTKSMQARIKQENERLYEELEKHHDLLLLSRHVDTYRSLPKKVLGFYNWVSVTQPTVKFTLKLDDDCFVNIDLILKSLDTELYPSLQRQAHQQQQQQQQQHQLYSSQSQQQQQQHYHTWWSRFRIGWPVDKVGKWKETEFTSNIYPAFACGGGNILSRDLVNWLSDNSHFLHSYQGEDVSVGIWLAPLFPTVVNDDRWHVLPGSCSKSMFTMPELSSEALLTMWDNLQRCNNPCTCEKDDDNDDDNNDGDDDDDEVEDNKEGESEQRRRLCGVFDSFMSNNKNECML